MTLRSQLSPVALLCGAIAVGLALVHTRPGRALEAHAIDWRTRWAGSEATGDPGIVLVDIGEASLRALEPAVGRWPWPRDVHGLMIDALSGAGARAIFYDIFFVERDLAHADADRALVESARRAGNVVIAALGQKQPGGPVEVPSLMPVDAAPIAVEFPGFLAPFPDLAAAARVVAPVNVAIDDDGVVRRGVMTVGYRGRRYATAPLVIASLIAGEPPVFPPGRVAVGARGLPLDENGRVLLRFRGEKGFRHLSFLDVFRAWGAKLHGLASEFDWTVFRDRVVIVSTTAAGLFDQHTGPYGGEYPGGELLATALDNLKRGDALREVSRRSASMLVIVIAIAASVPTLLGRGIWPLLFGLTLIGAYAVAAFVAFRTHGLVLPLLAPMVAAGIALGLGAGQRYLSESLERRRVRAVFSRYVSDHVVERLLASPGALDLGGSEAEITVLFSDIRDFTTHSERLAPSELVRQLNEYFGAVTEAIFREEGTVDKFIGDAVMAVFGAPLPQADHPRRAVRAALGMLSALEELNRRWREEGRPEWRIGVGIATGVAIVGNIGSARRTEFTVIGDTVNLASRLEGQNKALGTEILVSDATAARLGDGFAPRPHGEIRVKGKERPVTVYEIPRPQERR